MAQSKRTRYRPTGYPMATPNAAPVGRLRGGYDPHPGPAGLLLSLLRGLGSALLGVTFLYCAVVFTLAAGGA